MSFSRTRLLGNIVKIQNIQNMKLISFEVGTIYYGLLDSFTSIIEFLEFEAPEY